jgi:hypothetical protein
MGRSVADLMRALEETEAELESVDGAWHQLRRDLKELIGRHTSETGEHPVSVAELRNLYTPGSAPMYPAEPGWGATCSICYPEGDGVSSRFHRIDDEPLTPVEDEGPDGLQAPAADR